MDTARLSEAMRQAVMSVENFGENLRRFGELAGVHISDLRNATADMAGEPNYDPERCWRCDARRATYDVGLCDPCHADLASGDSAKEAGDE